MQLGTRTPSYLSMSSFQSIDFLSTSVRPLVCFHGKVCLIQVQIMALQLYLCKSSPGSNPIDIGKNFCSAQLYSYFGQFRFSSKSDKYDSGNRTCGSHFLFKSFFYYNRKANEHAGYLMGKDHRLTYEISAHI